MIGIVVPARAPFDFAASARFLRYTEAETVDNFHDGTYSRLVRFDNRLRLMRVRAAAAAGNTKTNLIVSLSPDPPKSPVAVAKRDAEASAALVARMFSVEHDLKKFRARVSGDSLMC